VLLVVVPPSLLLYAKGRPAAAVVALSPAAFINYLGLAYAAALAVAYAIYGGTRARIALAALALAGAALFTHKLAAVTQLASYAAQPPLAPWDPLWGLSTPSTALQRRS
jgi:hypothetical protein